MDGWMKSPSLTQPPPPPFVTTIHKKKRVYSCTIRWQKSQRQRQKKINAKAKNKNIAERPNGLNDQITSDKNANHCLVCARTRTSFTHIDS